IAHHLGCATQPCRTADEPLLPPDATHFSGIVPVACTPEAIEHYVKDEWAVSLEDLLVRRAGWHLYGIDAPLEQIAAWMAAAAGWSNEKRADEIAAFRRANA